MAVSLEPLHPFSDQVRADVSLEVVVLDLDVALFGESPPDRAKDALWELVEGHALLLLDPLTAEMLEAFGWEPPGGASGSTTCPRSGCR